MLTEVNLNTSKKNCLSLTNIGELLTGDTKIKQVKIIKYVGRILSEDGKCDNEIR